MISVDQTPLGSTPNSTPATYSGAFDLIRELFAKLPEAKVRGYTARRFSFNQAGGRCEACEGAGQKRIEMHFLPDVWITCDACGGTRYTRRDPGRPVPRQDDRRRARHVGRRRARVVRQRAARSAGSSRRSYDVGLGYLSLGQSAPTLSGGEAQRVKLAAELARPDTGKTLYILDEPTTGLHFDDVRKLLDVLHRLADLGNTVVVIEHNLDVIKTADWVIDLGPEAGFDGGDLVAEGTPEAIVAHAKGHTARFLEPVLDAGPRAERPRFDPKAAARAARKEKVGIPASPSIQRPGQAGKANGEPHAPLPEAQAPWEVDGRKWHTRDRVAANGRPARWDGRILETIVDRIEAMAGDGLAPTEWSERGVVRIRHP